MAEGSDTLSPPTSAEAVGKRDAKVDDIPAVFVERLVLLFRLKIRIAGGSFLILAQCRYAECACRQHIRAQSLQVALGEIQLQSNERSSTPLAENAKCIRNQASIVPIATRSAIVVATGSNFLWHYLPHRLGRVLFQILRKLSTIIQFLDTLPFAFIGHAVIQSYNSLIRCRSYS